MEITRCKNSTYGVCIIDKQKYTLHVFTVCVNPQCNNKYLFPLLLNSYAMSCNILRQHNIANETELAFCRILVKWPGIIQQ